MTPNAIPGYLLHTPKPIDELGNLYNVFISYKSQDSDLVRSVVEWLMSAGLKVWFAEYQILLHDRELFQDQIDLGVSKSQWAIAFTNRAYIESDHCQDELKALASVSGCKPDHLLEIVLGDRPEAKPFLERKGLPWITTPHQYSDLPELFQWLKNQLELPRVPIPTSKPDIPANNYQGMEGSYSMDLTDWEQISQEQGWQTDRTFEGPRFNLRDNSLASGSLTIASVRGVDRKSIQYGKEVSFQRNYFDALIEFAILEFSIDARDCVGVHLIHKNDQIHFATTSWCSEEWFRDYYIEMPDAYGNGLEFAMKFRFSGTFQEFCRFLPATDALAQSLWFDSTLRYITLIDLAARTTISEQNFQFSWALPIGWRRSNQKVGSTKCDINFHPTRRGLFRRLYDILLGRPKEASRQRIRRSLFNSKDLLNLQVHPLPRGFELEQLEQSARHTISKNGGTLTFHINGTRHGVRTYECLYRWRRLGHIEYGFQVHFILGEQIFSLQINSRSEIVKGDERLILASAFADSIRVPDQHHEPERNAATQRIEDGESVAASHYRAVRMSVGPPNCHLTLAAAEPEGSNVYLAYRWSEQLSQEQADQVDTCVRALINSKIGDIATPNDISVRLNWGEESLNGAPIPLWFLDHRNQPTYVVNSQFDMEQKIISLTVGSRFVPTGLDEDMHDPTSIGLYKGFMSLLTEIEITALT
ncbi:toll/interleukin-1 receptor domain-containing protein [Rubinisphaera sp.]|uniref:toll/interleukin-1 receptor domain-containing protein n=1 Tax=Rubinisphaera sp. TaxID=2024857 RepID=UPI000C104FCC|nr:toll/interleukin-1 receptor domain-containing protein [Rubinisphaera sp.]MBV11152.1 hypothetical protein [Rubinisphaera sp.]HCS54071.1 hypothetical protein [Planctomycetaceae bacterium]|tara:strand:+ start:1832 stop:3934 length:2103 start_codon:yes stop_codon:yes gene_type:complete